GAPQDALKDHGYFDSGCSKHMIGNISYLTNFKEHNGWYVAFGGGAKGGKIIGKSTIRTALTGVAALEELCLVVLIGTMPDLVKTAVGAKFLLELEKF
nr:hypothetical protein [Tanacetum cinerariifolium]